MPAWLLVALVPACATLVFALGLDASWDLRNYHYYNGWAALAGRFGVDLLVAQIPSFFNPVLDIPYYALTEALPARGVAYALGLVHALNAVPLFFIARALLAAGPWRDWAALGLTTAGLTGATMLSELGTTFHDNVISIPVLAGLALLAARWTRLTVPTVLLAGACLGLAVGFKLTSALYALAAGLGLLALAPGGWRVRLALAAALGAGGLLGIALGGGWWMAKLWSAYGNPLFPFYNHVFGSPWALAQSYRDPGFLPAAPGLLEALAFPLRLALEPRLASEAPFTDYRLPLLYALLPLAALALRYRPPANPMVRTGPTAWLLLVAALVWVLWLAQFRIYRYLLPLELLAPALITAALGLWLRGRAFAWVTAVVLALLVLTVRPQDWLRVPWRDVPAGARAVEVHLPALGETRGTLVLLAGHEPLAFLLPAFPANMRFIRIDSTFTRPEEDAVAFNPLMRRLVAEHEGPLAALYIATEAHEMRRKLAQYGLALVEARCADVEADIGAGRYRYCPVARPPRP